MIQLGLIKKDRFFHRDINWEIEKAAVNVSPPIVTGYKPAHLSLSLVLDELLTFNKYLIILMVRVMTSCVIPFSLCSIRDLKMILVENFQYVKEYLLQARNNLSLH